MVEVAPKWIVAMLNQELHKESEEKKMRIRSVGKILVGTAAMLSLATSLYLPLNVQAQRRAKKKTARSSKGYGCADGKRIRANQSQIG
jgi:hypothetical protein